MYYSGKKMDVVKKKNIETNAEIKTISDYAIILEELNGYSAEDSRKLAMESKGEPLFERLLERNKQLFTASGFVITGTNDDQINNEIGQAETKVRCGEPVQTCGQELLRAMMDRGNEFNEDGMPVIKMVDKNNGGSITYLRYDAVVKFCNINFIKK